MARHEDDGGLVAQRFAVERGAGLGVVRLDQHADHRLFAACETLLAAPDDVVEHPVDPLCRAVHRRRLEPRQPIRQPQEIRQVELRYLALIGGERGDDLGGVLGAEARSENRPADDLGGQGRHLAQRVDRRPRRQLGPARGGFGGRLDHGRGEQRQARSVDDRRDDPPAPLPQIAVADKEAVAEQRRQRMAHLRRLALKAFMQRDEGLRHRVGAVADKHPPVEQAGRKELILEAFVFENREQIAPRRREHRERRQRLARALRIRRHKLAHRPELAS